jgi:hypothetical protein
MPKLDQISSPTIFSGCDSNYWRQYGKSFVNSFKHFNPDKNVHIHLCNPEQQVLDEINSMPCNYSVQYITHDTLKNSANITKKYVLDELKNEELKSKIKFSLKFFTEGSDDEKYYNQIKFIYFACSRFIKLSEIWSGEHPVAAYDIDSICKGPIQFSDMLQTRSEGCLSVKGNRFVVSLAAFQQSSKMLRDWGDHLKRSFQEETLWGFLDQDTFVELSKKYNVHPIEKKFCDHTSKNHGALVITGKGQTKYGDFFKQEIDKWK